MIENALAAKQYGVKVKIGIKGAIAIALVALAVGLPQIVHLIAGPKGGAQWLPMYLPVLLAGCLLGVRWGIGVGVMSPLISFAITSAFGNAMPAAARLPYMTAELVAFGAISGAFSKSIAKNKWMAFPAVLLSFVGGRTLFIALAAIFQGVSTLSSEAAWAQIQSGLLAVVVQSTVVPLIVMFVAHCLDKRVVERAD